MKNHSLALSAAALAMGTAIGYALFSRRVFSFGGKVVVITGGSRGLGLVMARQLAAEGARLVLIARDTDELVRAAQQISSVTEVLAIPCDVRREADVKSAIARVASELGGVDVLINNAGIIQVGPLDTMTVDDFTDAMAVHFFGPLYFTLAVLPYMRERGGGRIVNISSIGGKIAAPHLLPYVASKFALVGLSDGLRHELTREKIFVTTVCPGMMRTGSPRNAVFKGRHHREHAWFSISGSLPLLSIDAETAARRIISACRNGDARLVIGGWAKAAVLLNEVAPNAAAQLLSLMNRVLPSASPEAQMQKPKKGYESESYLSPSWLTKLTEKAALKNNEIAATN